MDYIPVALAFAFAVGFAALLPLVGGLLGVRPNRPTAAKGYPYEAGSPVIGSPRARFSVRFYQVAILFLVFDIETAFLYPWAISYRALSCQEALVDGVCKAGVSFFGLGEIIVFMSILGVALAYVWRKRAVGWD